MDNQINDIDLKMGESADRIPPSPPKDLPTVESILEKLGGYSWFQLLATIIIISPEIPSAMIGISPVLTGSTNLLYTCDTQNGTQILSKQEICTFNKCGGPITSGHPPYTSVVQEWELHCERSWIVDTFTSIQMGGSMIGSIVCARFADRFGRKVVFYSLCFIMGSFGVIAGMAQYIAIFTLSRALTGFAVGGMYVVYLNYLMEFLTPNFRTICGCISFWAIGEMLLGLFGYWFPGWRELSYLTSIPAFLIMFSFPFLPESPRWLLCQNKTDDVVLVFNKIAKWNRKPQVDPADIRTLQKLISNKTTENHSAHQNGFLPLIFQLPELRKQMLIFMWAWFANAFVYYGLSFNTKNLSGDPNWNVFYLGLSDLPGSLSGMLFNNRFGRRRTFLGFSLLSALLLTSFAILRETYLVELYPFLTILLPLLGRYCTSASWGVLACFSAESFPTSNRASYIGVCSFSANIGGILAPQLAFIGTRWSSGPYIVFCTITIATSAASFALRETSGKPLQDTII